MAAPAAVLEGLGSSVPARVVTNDDLARAGLATSDEWILARTGIAQRHVADPDTATSDLAVEAAARALKSAGGGDVDALLLATTTPDRSCPSTAPEVVSRLGLGNIAAFDINGVCAGFITALATAGGLIATGTARRVVVVGAEVMTRIVDPQDRGTAVLFGDGAGAFVLRAGSADEPGAIGPFDLGSDGELAELLYVPAGGTRQRLDADTLGARDQYLKMDGRAVYREAVRRMSESSSAVLAKAGWAVADVDRFVGHQANARILDAVADRLGVPADRRVVNVDRYGNTSAASVPLALSDADVQPGHRVLLTAFGAGFTWGSTVLTWPRITRS